VVLELETGAEFEAVVVVELELEFGAMFWSVVVVELEVLPPVCPRTLVEVASDTRAAMTAAEMRNFFMGNGG
jgi:hypothetical protein